MNTSLVRSSHRERPTLFVGYTEGIINICYSTYSVRAAPFYPTTTVWGGPEVHYHPRTRTRTRRISPTDLGSTRALNQRISNLADDITSQYSWEKHSLTLFLHLRSLETICECTMIVGMLNSKFGRFQR